MKIINPYRFGGATSSLLTGLKVWWPMDETSGTRVNVHNPGVHDLTDATTCGYEAGVQGNAVTFVEAATGDYLTTANHADLVMGNRDYTAAGWAKFDTGSNSGALIIGFGDAAGQCWSVKRSGTTEAVIVRCREVTNTTTVQSGVLSITYSTFFFFLVQYSADVLSIEVNRGTPATVALTGGSYATTGDFFVGALSISANCLNGAVDEVGIWHRLLTTNEKDSLYNSGAGMAYPG